MLSTPLITIIVPTYNRADLIGATIKSVLGQTFQNWEMIIIDNFSDDNTEEVVNGFFDSRIQLHKLKRTGSVAASRNFGLAKSQSEWIAFLDSDDLWESIKLEVTIKNMSPNVDLIYHNLKIISGLSSEPTGKITQSRRLKKPIYFDLLLNGNPIPLSSVVIRKSILKKIGGMNESPNFFAVEDYETWLRVSLISNSFLFLPELLGSYRVHDSNISKDNSLQYVSNALELHLKGLTRRQLLRFQSPYIYQRVRSRYLKRLNKENSHDLWFVIKNGQFAFKIKAVYMLFGSLLSIKNPIQQEEPSDHE
jgi:glycosyltransferase involved in cell wall biosynthesis